MNTQLQTLPKHDHSISLLNLAIEIISLSYQYNETDKLDQLAIERELNQLINQACVKFDESVCLIRNLEYQTQYFRDLASSIQKKAQSAENAIERLKAYLIEVGTLDSRFLQGKVFKGSLYTRKSVDVFDPDALPEKYRIEKLEVKPNKKHILSDLEAGQVISGARLLEKRHLRIV